MQLRDCQARLAEDPEALCSHKVVHPLPFCREHYEEYCAANETHRSASQEVGRLKDVVDGIVKGAVDAYNTIGDLERDIAVIRLYLEAVQRRDEAREMLSMRFDSQRVAPGEDPTESTATAFAQQLEAKAPELRAEEEAHKAACEVLAILSVPHDPFPCEPKPTGTSPSPGRVVDRGERNGVSPPHASRRCPAMKLTAARCASPPLSGRRFCALHVATHASVTTMCRLQWVHLETCRKQVADVKVGKGNVNIAAASVMAYIRNLEFVENESERHQSTYSCASPEEHGRCLKEIRRRRVGAALLHAQVKGRKDAEIALRQGQFDVWASEYLAEIKAADAEKDKAFGGALVSAAAGAGLASVAGSALAVGALMGATVWLVGWSATRTNLKKDGNSAV